jgi:hypothetical protein
MEFKKRRVHLYFAKITHEASIRFINVVEICNGYAEKSEISAVIDEIRVILTNTSLKSGCLVPALQLPIPGLNHEAGILVLTRLIVIRFSGMHMEMEWMLFFLMYVRVCE